MADLTKEWDKATPISSEEWEGATPIEKPGRTMGEALKSPEYGWQGEIRKSPPRWVPWARTGAELVGFGAGSLLGGPVGAGLGYAASRQLTKLLPSTPPRPLLKEDVEKELGVPVSEAEYQDILKGGPQWTGLHKKLGLVPPTTVEKAIGRAGEVGMDVATGVAMEAGGQLASKAIPRMLPLYAKGRTPAATELAGVAEREGVRIPAPDITGSTAQSAIASSVTKLPQSAYTMQKEAVTATEQFSNYVERTLGELGGKQEPYIAGQAGKEGIATKLAQNRAQGDVLYTKATELAKDVPVTFENTLGAIEKIQASDRYKLLSESGRKEVDNFINLLKQRTMPASGEVGVPTAGGATVPMTVSKGAGRGFIDKEALEATVRESGGVTDFLGAEGLRKSLADKVFVRTGKKMESYGPMKDIYRAFEDDMASSAEKAGTEAYTAFKGARDFTSKNVFGVFGEAGKKGVLTKIKEASPERAVNLLRSASIDDIRSIKKGMPATDFTTFRQGFLTQIFQKNSRRSEITGETIYNGSQIAKDLFGKTGIGEARLKELLPPREVTFLKELATVGERMGSSWRIAGNPSGTAHTLYVLHLLGQIGSIPAAVLAGEAGGRKGDLSSKLAIAGAFLSPYVVAKLVTSNIGRQYLIGGFPKAERAVGRALPFGLLGARGMFEQPQQEIVRPPANTDKELASAYQALEKGVPLETVKKEFKKRTGEEWPD